VIGIEHTRPNTDSLINRDVSDIPFKKYLFTGLNGIGKQLPVKVLGSITAH
jgi:hypothetical protein